MKSIAINNTGRQSTRDWDRKELSSQFGLHHRDLRPLFSLRQVATVLSRKEVIIVNLGLLKLLISQERVLIFNLENKEVIQEFVPALKDKLKQLRKDQDFELVVLDFAFNYKIKHMKGIVEKLQSGVTKVLKIVEKNYSLINLEKLLKLKKNVSNFEIVVRENLEAGEEILEDDEELIDICLSQRKKRNVDFEEAESIFDSFVEQVEEIGHRVDELKENIDDTQEILSLKIDSQRNSIIRSELIATLITALFALMAVITGLYGMNIQNNLEGNYTAFLMIIIGFVFSAIVFVLGMFAYLKHKKIL